MLKPGTSLSIRTGTGVVNAYQPLVNGPRDLYTISATALAQQTPPPAPTVHSIPGGLIVSAPGSLQALLVRVPDGVNLDVDSRRGNVNVTDITGNVRVVAREGNVDVKVPGYAQAAAGRR